MSAALVVLCLIGTAAMVWSACFVGCNLDHAGPVGDYYQYHSRVTTTSGLVAYWPLSDTDTRRNFAVDLGPNHFNGTYTLGPIVAFNAAEQSDASPGGFTLNEPNIVAGDTVSTDGGPARLNPCVYFNGGYVSVAWQAALGPPLPAQFTLEAWVVPDWTAEHALTNPAFRAVVACAEVARFAGFALLATPDNLWQFQIGNGSGYLPATTGGNHPIVQGSLYFLVVTYDGTTVTLWVNPADMTQPPDATAAAGGYVQVASPVPFFIGRGRPDLPTGRFPFKGRIQDVAFYNVVLDNNTIETHYMNGLGMQM